LALGLPASTNIVYTPHCYNIEVQDIIIKRWDGYSYDTESDRYNKNRRSDYSESRGKLKIASMELLKLYGYTEREAREMIDRTYTMYELISKFSYNPAYPDRHGSLSCTNALPSNPWDPGALIYFCTILVRVLFLCIYLHSYI